MLLVGAPEIGLAHNRRIRNFRNSPVGKQLAGHEHDNSGAYTLHEFEIVFDQDERQLLGRHQTAEHFAHHRPFLDREAGSRLIQDHHTGLQGEYHCELKGLSLAMADIEPARSIPRQDRVP